MSLLLFGRRVSLLAGYKERESCPLFFFDQTFIKILGGLFVKRRKCLTEKFDGELNFIHKYFAFSLNDYFFKLCLAIQIE